MKLKILAMLIEIYSWRNPPIIKDNASIINDIISIKKIDIIGIFILLFPYEILAMNESIVTEKTNNKISNIITSKKIDNIYYNNKRIKLHKMTLYIEIYIVYYIN